ncbi:MULTISPECIES: DUF3987 domain-containing protein, partial [Pseudomonas]
MPWRGELLPAVLQEYVRDVAERTQCPPDFVGVALVVAVSAVVGRKFTIHPKQHDDWTVVPNQWGVIIGRPSAMKTPALKQALRPLDALETRERNQHSMALEEYRTNSELLDIERKAAKSKATKLVGSGDLLPDFSTTPNLVESVFRAGDGSEKAFYRRADSRLPQAGGGR